jgi:hypothetical protein
MPKHKKSGKAPLDLATDLEIRHAAKYAGVDELGEREFNAIESKKLSAAQRELLIAGLRRMHYIGIDNDGNGWIVPIKASAEAIRAEKMPDINISFSRELLKRVHADVKKVAPEVNLTRHAWVYCVGRGHWEFNGPYDFYWHGSADNAYDARCKGWYAWLAEFGTQEKPNG